MLDQLQIVNEQLQKLQAEPSVEDIELWKASEMLKADLEREQSSKFQQYFEQRVVCTVKKLCIIKTVPSCFCLRVNKLLSVKSRNVASK